MKKILLAFLLAVSPAFAQDGPNHALPVFGGAGFSGFRAAGPCTATQLLYWGSGVGSDPACSSTLPSGLTGFALTKTDDTNVTLTLGGSPATALVNAASITAGWTGTLAAARLNANVVQAITNDTNVTGSITTQNLTLGWTGTLAYARGGTGAGSFTTNGIVYAGASALASDRCTMDSSQNVSCSSANAFSPQYNLTNSTSDANSTFFNFNKSRSGGNTNSGDGFGNLLWSGFANSAFRGATQIRSTQTAASSGSNIPSSITFSTSNASGLLNQSMVLDQNGHHGFVTSAVPTASACAGFALTTGSSDVAGRVTYTSATTCNISFGAAYATAPFCQVTPGSAASTTFITTSTTVLSITFGTAQTAFFYQCFGA